MASDLFGNEARVDTIEVDRAVLARIRRLARRVDEMLKEPTLASLIGRVRAEKLQEDVDYIIRRS